MNFGHLRISESGMGGEYSTLVLTSTMSGAVVVSPVSSFRIRYVLSLTHTILTLYNVMVLGATVGSIHPQHSTDTQLFF